MAFTTKDWNILGRLLISLIVLAAALYVILSNAYPDAHLKWAFGIVGVIIGYWIK